MGAADLVAALERLHPGERVSDRSPAGDLDGADWPGRGDGLSAREAEVLALITQDLTNDEIARQTYLSINSVKSYLRSAYRKIGGTRRSQVVLWGSVTGSSPTRYVDAAPTPRTAERCRGALGRVGPPVPG